LLNWTEFGFLLAQAFERLERGLFRRVFLHHTLLDDPVDFVVVSGDFLQFDFGLVDQNITGLAYQTGFLPEAETVGFDFVVDDVELVAHHSVDGFFRDSGFLATLFPPFLPLGFLLVG
jgi:hypothetical protein